eukprot:TRINITY_DN38624_c0_g1_i1.p1 TRINITY_DN38624_c0_g1~~TRINITY_DN38624_c0_g1_i1.p1  ORF type:complete len:138 (+),score=26.77 TRINITY_DN38624_c0_g1_i1:118-531(+)
MKMHQSRLCVSVGVLLLTVTLSWTHSGAERRDGLVDTARMRVDEALPPAAGKDVTVKMVLDAMQQNYFVAPKFRDAEIQQLIKDHKDKSAEEIADVFYANPSFNEEEAQKLESQNAQVVPSTQSEGDKDKPDAQKQL